MKVNDQQLSVIRERAADWLSDNFGVRGFNAGVSLANADLATIRKTMAEHACRMLCVGRVSAIK